MKCGMWSAERPREAIEAFLDGHSAEHEELF
jgi:hypothetical protein